ncbi:TIR domain-containing protein [Companilactobacillus pabuli]|uniref:TIR domain-containing protein n=1 Tax=Companilactobacillus TaxID=2767879 RepID=UPI00241F6417|nr:TIR domain-containing protein [Companilactobacillus farciminis]
MHKSFISYKTEDQDYKNELQELLGNTVIDKSLNEPINSIDENYIMRKIREEHLKDSTITLVLIGERSYEKGLFYENQTYIKRELQASLYDIPNGIVGIVLPSMTDKIFKGDYKCPNCGETHNATIIDDSTVIREFSKNFYIENHSGCAWNYDDRYCNLTIWDKFKNNPDFYINLAFDKRTAPVAKKIMVFPK